MSSNGNTIPHLPSTACTLAFSDALLLTSLCRCRTSSRRARTTGGAIHDSARSPIRSNRASSAASRASVLTRRLCIDALPFGCARCTSNPAACNTSTAQYHPNVASTATGAPEPALATSATRSRSELSICTQSTTSPPGSIRAITLRRRARSTPTNCRCAAYDFFTVASHQRGCSDNPSMTRAPQEREAPSPHRITSGRSRASRVAAPRSCPSDLGQTPGVSTWHRPRSVRGLLPVR